MIDSIPGGGDFNELIRTRKWESTFIGPLSHWPQSLRTAINICLSTPIPAAVLWGKDLTQIYNKSYVPYCDHPEAMGRVFSANWQEDWHILKDWVSRAASGQAVKEQEVPLKIKRGGGNVLRFFSVTFDPIYDGDGKVAGVFHTLTESQHSPLREQVQLQTEERLNRFFMNAPAAIAIVHGPNHVYTFANHTYQQIFGRTEKQLIGKPIKDVFSEVADRGMPNPLKEVYESGEAFVTTEYALTFLRNRTLETGYFNLSAQPIKDIDGQVTEILLHVYEVTDQVRTRQKAQESEVRKSAILDSSRDAIITIDHGGAVVEWNRAAEKLFGHAREAVVGKEMAEIIVPARMRKAHYQGLKHYLETGEGPVLGQLLEMPAMKADGTEFLSELSIVDTRDADVPLFTATMRDITARKEAEKALLESEDRFRATFDEAAIPISITDFNGKWIALNNQYVKAFGYTKEELEKMSFRDITHPDDIESDNSDIIRLFRGEVASVQKEKRYVRKDGAIIHGVVNLSITRNAEGEPSSIIAAIQDVTERKKAEEALRRSEERFRLLADNIPNLCWMARADGSVYWLNSRWSEYTGKSAEELKGWAWQQVLDPATAPDVLEMWKKAIYEGAPFESVMYLKGKDDQFNPYLTRIIPSPDADGKVQQWFGTFTDITNVRKAEEILEYQKSLLEAQREVSPLGIVVISPEGKIISYNKLFPEMWRLPVEVIHEKLDEYALLSVQDQLEDSEAFISKVQEVYRTRTVNQEKLYFKDGRIFKRYGSPIRNADGVYYGYVWYFQDITQQERLAKQKDEFIGIASHELKTPVTSIKAYTQVLQSKLETIDSEASHMLKRMDAQLDKLTKLITDLLDITKIEQGKLQFQKSRFDLNQLVREVVEEVQQTTRQHVLKLELTNESTILYADKDRVSQVLSNFLTNAIKYSPKAEEVQVKTECIAGNVRFSVRDFGVGLSDEDQRKVFERFYRVQGVGYETYPGLGLGLYIAAEIILRHQGQIWVESKEATGSTFYFSLPCAV